MRRRLRPLLNPASPSVRGRLIGLALLGVGLPILFLGGLGIFQTTQIARFLRETTVEYGHYAAHLVSSALEREVSTRANTAAENARLAAGWGGASPDFLTLLTSRDPMFKDPWFVPVEVARARLQGVVTSPIRDDLSPTPGPEPLPPVEEPAAPEGPREGPGGAFGVLPEGVQPRSGRPRDELAPVPADSSVVSVPVLRGMTSDVPGGEGAMQMPAWFWRRLLAADRDTMMMLPPGATGPGSPAWVAFPILGFPGRPVAIAGWRFDDSGLRHKQLHELVEREVYRDPRVFRGDVMQRGIAILLYDATGREVYRSREVGRRDGRVEHEIGGMLPGWRVAAAPSRANAFTTIQRFIVGEYVLMLALLAFSLVALVLALRLAVQQVEVAELKSGFLANVTHELKTPLAMIRMASETLELGRVRSEADSQRFLATISRECRRLTHMINNVLDFAKIEEGKREFLFAPADLGKVVRDTLEIFEPQFKQGGFRVEVDLPERLPPVEMDQQAITQCVINLVDNAIKYSRDARELAIRVSVDGAARVAVTDRGIGVAPRDVERVFEKFTRAETGLVHNVKGSGLGLALVRHIARAHGGDVELKSVLGEGSTFTLVLPLKQAQRKEEDGWRRES